MILRQNRSPPARSRAAWRARRPEPWPPAGSWSWTSAAWRTIRSMRGGLAGGACGEFRASVLRGYCHRIDDIRRENFKPGDNSWPLPAGKNQVNTDRQTRAKSKPSFIGGRRGLLRATTMPAVRWARAACGLSVLGRELGDERRFFLGGEGVLGEHLCTARASLRPSTLNSIPKRAAIGGQGRMKAVRHRWDSARRSRTSLSLRITRHPRL